MKITIILFFGVLFSIHSLQSKDEITPEDKTNLSNELALILHSGVKKDHPSLYQSSTIVLIDLVFNNPLGSELSIPHGDRLSEDIIDYYFYLYKKKSTDTSLVKSVVKVIRILNREMTKGVKPQSIYHAERKAFFEATEQAIKDIPKLSVNNQGAINLKLALAYTKIIFETDKPYLVTNTKDIRFLVNMAPVAEDWGLKSASKAILLAAAMAADKFSYMDGLPIPKQ